MAKNPTNPLDVFTTYTYHFHLIVAKSWDDLAKAENTSTNVTTSPTHGTEVKGTGALVLINTSKDAHQTIDDVNFGYIGPSANNKGHFIPDGKMSFKVFEPNRIYFIEKIRNTMLRYNISDLSSLHWALKVYFVGRTPDNKVVTLPQHGVLIPMSFVEMEASFSNAGGEYNLSFVSASSFAGSNDEKAMSTVMLAGYCNQTISFSARTVREALASLEKELNDNYTETYKTILSNKSKARGIKYFIRVLDKDIDGALDINGSNKVGGGLVPMSFSPDQTITEWIFTILRSSDRLNKMVGESLEGIRKSGHPGVKILSIFPRFVGLETELHIIYDIHLYRGINQKNPLEFDFMFSSPGKNVDVMGFDIHLKTSLAWFSNNSSHSNEGLFNTSGMTAKKDSSQFALEDKKTANSQKKIEPSYAIPAKGGDFALLPIHTQAESSGMPRYNSEEATANAKIMFNSITQMHGAFDPMFNFTIRGHLNLLTAGIVYPDTTTGDQHDIPFGIKSPLWVKVNIKSPNDQQTSFFYTGNYNVISIQNHFSAGKFIQTLNVMMMSGLGGPTPEETAAKDAKTIENVHKKYSNVEEKKVFKTTSAVAKG